MKHCARLEDITKAAWGLAALELAASIALKHGQPKTAVLLLDEGICLVNETTWSTNGGDFLLLYARALEQERDTKHAVQMLSVSSELSAGVSIPSYISALYTLSRISSSQNSSRDASTYAQQAFDAMNSGRRQIGTEEQKFAFLTDKEEIASWMFKVLLESGADATAILKSVESWKMRTFLDVHEESAGVLPLPDVNSLPSSLSDKLDSGDVILDLVVGEHVSFGILISKLAPPKVFRIAASRGSILAAVKRVSEDFDLSNPQSIESIRSDKLDPSLMRGLRELYDDLLLPAPIPNGTKRLIIATDNHLMGVPWPALLENAESGVVDRYETVVVPSATMAEWSSLRAATIKRDSGAEGRALVVCSLAGGKALNPDTNQPTGTLNFAPLKNGWNECEAVSQRIQGAPVTILIDRQTAKNHGLRYDKSKATPENFFSKIKSARFVHVVAHGIFDRNEPMLSRIYLGEVEDSRTVDAADLAQLRLEKTEFVSLASCQTGVAGSAPGSEPLGFVRALFSAGVPSVLLAEWETDDDVTSRLLKSYYELARTQRKSEALRQAQLGVRRTFAHPYFWSGIALYGQGN